MLVVGLTGGIASGKSTVADEFQRLGADVIDTDQLARQVVAPGTDGLNVVTHTFGPGMLNADGELDRSALRRRIFADADARSRLEAILHPRIRACTEARINASAGPYVLLVIPLLVESNWQQQVDRVLVVDADETQQMERLQARDGSNTDDARAALAAQASRQQRLAHAHDVIDNRGETTTLREAVAGLHTRYLVLSG